MKTNLNTQTLMRPLFGIKPVPHSRRLVDSIPYINELNL